MIDWTILASLAAVIAALAAVMTAGVMVWQTRYTTKTQVLLQLTNSWQSAPLFPVVRKKAARTLMDAINETAGYPHNENQIRSTDQSLNIHISSRNNNDIDQVIDFLETVAIFTNKNMLDFELTYQFFWWPVVCYWVLLEKYIIDTQKNYGDEVWENYRKLALRFIKRDGERVTRAQAEEFLNDELAL